MPVGSPYGAQPQNNSEFWMAKLRRTKRISNTGEDMSQTNFASEILLGNQRHAGSSFAKSGTVACPKPVPAGDPAKHAVLVAIPDCIFEVDVGKPSDALPENRLPV